MTENFTRQGGSLTPPRSAPALQFSTEDFPAGDQFDVWREFMAPVCEVLEPEGARSGFHGAVEAYDIGILRLVSLDSEQASFLRTREHEYRYGIDHWCLTFVDSGEMIVNEHDGSKVRVSGDMLLKSYASSFSGIGGGRRISCLFISRDDLSEYAAQLETQAGRNLVGPVAPILRQFVISLQRQVQYLSNDDIPAINDAFLSLLKVTVSPDADTLERAKAPMAATQFSMAKQIVRENLSSPALSPDMLCRRLGISRRQLFYIFEPYGGVMKFIAQQRLAACYRAIVRQSGRKTIGTIAYEYGFTNLPSFYRQFHARFGMKPGDARAALIEGDGGGKVDNSLRTWLAGDREGLSTIPYA